MSQRGKTTPETLVSGGNLQQEPEIFADDARSNGLTTTRAHPYNAHTRYLEGQGPRFARMSHEPAVVRDLAPQW